MHICSPVKLTVVNRIMWKQNEEVTNKQWCSDSLKKGLFFGGNKQLSIPSPLYLLICRHLISRLTFRGKNMFKLILKLLLKTNFKQITSYRHLPPIPFLAVCKCTVLLRQISHQNQPHYRAFLLYTQNYIKPKSVGGWGRTSVAAKKKSNRICQYTTKNHP